MPHSQLDNLVRIGQLKVEPPAESEIAGLMRSGLSRLADAERVQLSLESRYDLAYNSSHALALAALRHHGYRSESRCMVFQMSSTHTRSAEGTMASSRSGAPQTQYGEV